jgi:hypothetical protein
MYASKNGAYQYDFIYNALENEIEAKYFSNDGDVMGYRDVFKFYSPTMQSNGMGCVAYTIETEQNDNFNRWMQTNTKMSCKTIRIINQIPELARWLFKQYPDGYVVSGYDYRNPTYRSIENATTAKILDMMLNRIRYECQGFPLRGTDIEVICKKLRPISKAHMPFQRFQINDRVVICDENAVAGPASRRTKFYGLHGYISNYNKDTNSYIMVADKYPNSCVGWVHSSKFEFESKW